MDGSFGRDGRWFVPHENTAGNDRLLRNATIGVSLAILALCAALLCGVALCSYDGTGRDEPATGSGVGP